MTKFFGIHREMTTTADGKLARTLEYDMSTTMASSVKLYNGTIEEIAPSTISLRRPTDLPNGTGKDGGNAPSADNKVFGDRLEHYPDIEAWRRVHDRPITALFTPVGTISGPEDP